MEVINFQSPFLMAMRQNESGESRVDVQEIFYRGGLRQNYSCLQLLYEWIVQKPTLERWQRCRWCKWSYGLGIRSNTFGPRYDKGDAMAGFVDVGFAATINVVRLVSLGVVSDDAKVVDVVRLICRNLCIKEPLSLVYKMRVFSRCWFLSKTS